MVQHLSLHHVTRGGKRFRKVSNVNSCRNHTLYNYTVYKSHSWRWWYSLPV